jgi:hypothetical protein
MTDQIILNLPDDLSAIIRQIAETKSQPVEQVLLEHLKTLTAAQPSLPLDVQAELDALEHLSDDALWTIAHEQMPADIQARAHELMDKRLLTNEEQVEIDDLVERGDRLMLRKAEAADLLRQRGYPFAQSDFRQRDE